MNSIWSYTAQSGRDTQAAIIGYDVEAVDGSIGEVTEESVDVDASHIVVDTGFWILEKKRLVPAGAISRVDHENSKVQLSLTKEEIKNAPDYVERSKVADDVAHRDQYSEYYSPWMGL